MRLRNIVVGMDFNEPSLDAARWAAHHLAPGADIVLVYTIELPEPPEYLETILPPRETLLEAAHRDAEGPLRELSRSIDSKSVRTELRVGRPATEISEVAREEGAGLIVVGERGRRGRRGPSRNGLGSTADQLVRCAPAPVLVGRDLPDSPPRRILVPLDASEMLPLVLDWGRYLSRVFDAELIALNTLSYGLYGALRLARSASEAEALESASREAAEAWLRERLIEADVDPGKSDVQIAFGQPAFEIVSAAQRLDVDLIIMGSRGRQRAPLATLGSVASAVLRNAPGPVLVVADPACE